MKWKPSNPKCNRTDVIKWHLGSPASKMSNLRLSKRTGCHYLGYFYCSENLTGPRVRHSWPWRNPAASTLKRRSRFHIGTADKCWAEDFIKIRSVSRSASWLPYVSFWLLQTDFHSALQWIFLFSNRNFLDWFCATDQQLQYSFLNAECTWSLKQMHFRFAYKVK